MRIETWNHDLLTQCADLEGAIFGEICFFMAHPLPVYRHCFFSDSGYALVDIVEGEAELVQIGVEESSRGKGVGQTLMKEILDYIGSIRVKRIFLEVRLSNHAALALYKSHGFKQVGRRNGYYSNPKEDALVFALQTLS